MSALEDLLKLGETPRDGAQLRFSLGNEYMKPGNPAQAVVHLRAALQQDPNYSAAWQLLGKVLTDSDRPVEAIERYRQGIAVADARDDVQAAKEMKVFARRIARAAAAPMSATWDRCGSMH